jgi:Fur family peroxide stress response transcriptional regulator
MKLVKEKSGSLDDDLVGRLSARGFRFTPQREHIYHVLRQERDHPTAETVFIRAKKGMPEISMATVYNCLDALVECGLVRLVNRERNATRYCPNMHEHHHFYCEKCGGAFDIDILPDAPKPSVPVPRGFRPSRYEVIIHGTCPKCGSALGSRHRS